MGISAKGERIHIYKKDILKLFPKVGIVYRCLGRYEKELVTLPFYCLAENETYDYINFDGTKTGEKFTTLTAFAISDKEYEIKVAAVNHWSASELQSRIDSYEIQLKYYRTENVSLRTQIENVGEDYNKLVCKNDELDSMLQTANWNYEYAQSERERLELLCKEHEYTIIELLKDNDELEKYKKAFDALTTLTSYQLNQLIDNV